MKLMVIEGGRGRMQEPASPSRPTASDVHAEASRRIRLTGYDSWLIREFATGATMPHSIRHLQMQIAYAAHALARFAPIPQDFRSDLYWPLG